MSTYILNNGHFQHQLGLATSSEPQHITPGCTGFNGFPDVKRVFGSEVYSSDKLMYHCDRRMVIDYNEI